MVGNIIKAMKASLIKRYFRIKFCFLRLSEWRLVFVLFISKFWRIIIKNNTCSWELFIFSKLILQRFYSWFVSLLFIISRLFNYFLALFTCKNYLIYCLNIILFIRIPNVTDHPSRMIFLIEFMYLLLNWFTIYLFSWIRTRRRRWCCWTASSTVRTPSRRCLGRTGACWTCRPRISR